jgi:hypothetical protein
MKRREEDSIPSSSMRKGLLVAAGSKQRRSMKIE